MKLLFLLILLVLQGCTVLHGKFYIRPEGFVTITNDRSCPEDQKLIIMGNKIYYSKNF